MSIANPITVLNGTLQLHQVEGGFKTSIDAVLLAAACPARGGHHILDLGCGVGSAGLCVLTRINDTHLTGLDIQPDHIDAAHQNASLNKFPERSVFKCTDIRDFHDGGFDHVICNPPYEEAGEHLISPSAKNATARGHLDKDITIEDWVKCAFNSVKSGGSFTIIHKAAKTQAIIRALGKSFGATEIIPLWPKAGKEAKRVVIRTIKHRKSPSHLHAGLVLHNNDGTYTEAANAILRNQEAL